MSEASVSLPQFGGLETTLLWLVLAASVVALVTFRGVNEEKVLFTSESVKKEIEKLLEKFPSAILAGPAPAPLLKAEGEFRFQIMIRLKAMGKLSRALGAMQQHLKLPEGVVMTIDIDPVNLS